MFPLPNCILCPPGTIVWLQGKRRTRYRNDEIGTNIYVLCSLHLYFLRKALYSQGKLSLSFFKDLQYVCWSQQSTHCYLFKAGFPKLSTIDILDKIILCCRGCPRNCRMLVASLDRPATPCTHRPTPPGRDNHKWLQALLPFESHWFKVEISQEGKQ